MASSYSVIAFSGSLRQASTNKGLLRCAQQMAPQGLDISLLDIADIPFFNADVEAQGQPKVVQQAVARIQAADALLLACPEYNYSMAPALKNMLDWASRVPNNAALAGKPIVLVGAGGGMGTSRAQYHLRQTCVYLDLLPLNKPEFFANAFAGGFDAQGNVADKVLQEQMQALLTSFYNWIAKVRTAG